MLYVYALNLARIVVLFLVYSRRPSWAETAHVTAGQTFIILMVILFLLLWIEWVVETPRDTAAALPPQP